MDLASLQWLVGVCFAGFGGVLLYILKAQNDMMSQLNQAIAAVRAENQTVEEKCTQNIERLRAEVYKDYVNNTEFAIYEQRMQVLVTEIKSEFKEMRKDLQHLGVKVP